MNMRWNPQKLSVGILLLVTILIIGACDDGGSNPLPGFFGDEEVDETALTAEAAEQIATTFLDYWRDGDLEKMYGYISPNAKDSYPPERFIETYQEAQNKMNVTGVSYQLQSVIVQGNTAAVSYRVTFDTTLLGQFADPANPDEVRVMRMISTPEGWRIAWSRMDIVSDWTSNTDIRVERQLPTRGNIYDRNGKVLVDQNGRDFGLDIIKQNIPNEATCVADLARVLREDVQSIQAKFDGYNLDTRFSIGRISQETASAELTRLEQTCRVISYPIAIRQYWDRVAPHIIGYVGRIPAEQAELYAAQGYPPDALVGLLGVERAFEEQLRGTIGISLVIRSLDTGTIIRTIAERQAEPGQSVYLSIDRDLQLTVQSLFAETYSLAIPTWGQTSKGAAAVVMDVNTGEVLAIASYPDFDQSVFNPNTPLFDPASQIGEYRNDPRTPMVNRATQGIYPLGSVFKVFSVAAGLDTEIWDPNRTANCNCNWTGPDGIDRTDWYCGSSFSPGIVDPQRALVTSCNIFFWDLSVAMNSVDPNALPSYVQKFGFGTAPPFQGIQTAAGLIPNPTWKNQRAQQETGVSPWSVSDAINTVIGQGEVGVSPLQVARAIAVIANGGTLYDPLIANRVQLFGSEPLIVYEPQGKQLDLDPEVLAEVREAMCDVTTEPIGTANYIYGWWYDDNGYQITICGKTGSAESGQAKSHAWFAAFAPADQPQIAVAVIVENSCEGSEVAAPIVREIIAAYYGIPRHPTPWPPLWETGCQAIGPD